ncbi:uncharacterized protein TNCV_258751 [Trichonephila clavipes]|uniref:Transposase Tc1-like domain-containing protein n=1 Tax=Trichonephila clavipes TaxID=2585209 RepID=A0A8X6S3H6_TRICX|nr:uncharacterized protein TNCV_258751 [Trichonephila clavipes]
MSSRHHIDDFMRGRIIGKIEEGRKITDVARKFDIAHSVVSRLWKSFKTTGMCSRRHGGGKQISRKTVARRLRGGGLYARRPVVCVPLTRQYRTARLQWCREHHNWTEQDWDCLDSEGIQRLVWPTRSPDLNPIENVWDALGGKLLVETILRQTRTPSSVHSQRNGINCLNSCWIMVCKVWYDVWNVASHSTVDISGTDTFL